MNTFLKLSPDFLQMHPAWQVLFKGMMMGKEMAVILAAFGFLCFGVWWLTKQMRFRIPGIYFLLFFGLISSSWFASSILANSLKDYQRKRLIVFFEPGVDPLGSGYHVIQSVIALGSGKLLGKGLFAGTQGRLGFLPEQHTDFIFSVLGEELGFLVSAFVLFLYFVLVWRCIVIAEQSRDRYGTIIATGIASMYGFYTLLNLAMVMGLAPVTGLPLPFLSYGGSAMVSSLAAAGILLSIHIRRYTH
jgi:rod shape determining protein RodA